MVGNAPAANMLAGAGVDYTALAVSLEEVAAADAAASAAVSVNNCPACKVLLVGNALTT